MIFKAIETVSTIMILICVGYFISKIGWYKKEYKSFLVKLIINVAVPSVIIKTFLVVFPRELLFSSGRMMFLVLMGILVPYLFASLIKRSLGFHELKGNGFVALSSMSNAMFIGLPVCQSLFGDEGMPYVMIYYLVSTCFLWIYFAPKFSGEKLEGSFGERLKGNLKNLVSVPLITLMISIILALLNFRLPKVLLDSFNYLGGMSTPLSLIFIGGVIYEVGIRNLRFELASIFIIISKFMVAPIGMFIIMNRFSNSQLATQVFTVLAGMPPMTQLGVIAANSKHISEDDNEFIMTHIAALTVLSLVFIPLYMVLMPKFL